MERGRVRLLRLLLLGALASAAAVALSLTADSAWANEEDTRGILGGAVASLSQTTDALTHEVAQITDAATGALGGVVSGTVTPVVEHVAPPALGGAVMPLVGDVDGLVTGSVSRINGVLASTVSGVVGAVDTTVGGVVGGLAPDVEPIVPPVIEATQPNAAPDDVSGDIAFLLSNETDAPLASVTNLNQGVAGSPGDFAASVDVESDSAPATPNGSPFGVPAMPSGAPATSSSAGHDGLRTVAVGSDVGIAAPGLTAEVATASDDALPPSLSYGTDSPPD